MAKKTDSSTVAFFAEAYGRKHLGNSLKTLIDGSEEESGDEYFTPLMVVVLMLQYLEITGTHADAARELSVTVRNAVLKPGKLPLYVVVSNPTFEIFKAEEIGAMQARVAEVAAAEIREVCGDNTV